MKRLLAFVCAALIAPAALSSPTWAATPAKWAGTWGAPPAPPAANARTFENQTLRQVVRISAGGKRVRVRLTNEYGPNALSIGAASISDGAKTVPLTFGGKTSVVIPKASPMYSDAIDLPVKALSSLTIDIYLPKKTDPCTCHPQGTAVAQVSPPGDFTGGKPFTPTTPAFVQRAFLSGVEVEPVSATKVIVTFGDSITDGTRSTNDGNHRWHDVLAERLGGKYGVVNAAISGNRVINYGNAVFGDSALARFDRDVLSVPGATYVTMLEGINDLGMTTNPRPSAAEVILGYRQIVERAHAHGLKIYAATLMPYTGAAYYSDDGEKTRQEINAWLRSKDSAFDGLIDFDKVMQDPANPAKLKPALQSGDWLHPNDAGYKLMGDSVDLKLFR